MDSSSLLIIGIAVVLAGAVIGVLVLGRSSASTAAPQKVKEPVSVTQSATPASGSSSEEVSEAARARADEARDAAVRAASGDTNTKPVDEEALGVTRRQFLNRGILTMLGIGFLAPFGVSLIAFLWPSASSGGFGGKIKIGKLSEIKASIDANKKPFYAPDARAYVSAYPVNDVSKAKAIYPAEIVQNMQQGVVVLYQKCPHLGCRVPFCSSSQWFECPCHGSKYNRVGEKTGGPAPRGMDRFVASIVGDAVTVDTGTIIEGPVIGTNTTGQSPEGPLCV